MSADPCSLDGPSVLAYLRSLRPQDGAAYAEAVIELARRVRERQIEIATAEWEECRLWRDGQGRARGVINAQGQLRRVQRSYARDWEGRPTHWHVDMAYMPVISAINRALTDVDYRWSHRKAQVRSVRPQPKHYYILRWLGVSEQISDTNEKSQDTHDVAGSQTTKG
jgi:phytoene dehydrogenase-like protein